MTSPAEQTLDTAISNAIRQHPDSDDGEIFIDWIVIAATRTPQQLADNDNPTTTISHWAPSGLPAHTALGLLQLVSDALRGIGTEDEQ